MRDFIAAIVLLAVGVLAGIVYSQQASLSLDQQALMQIGDSLTLKSDSIALDVQEKCTKQAESVYKDYSTGSPGIWSYVDHYNINLKKCFVLLNEISSTGSVGSESDTLLDAFELKTFAYFDEVTNAPEPPKIAYCYVYSNSGQKIECRSDVEFFSLIPQYVGSANLVDP